MSTNDNLHERLLKLSDEKLLKMLHYESDYRPEAIAVAKQILDHRDIAPEKKEELLSEFIEKEKANFELASADLSRGEKLLYTIIPFIGLVVWFQYSRADESEGYSAKKRQSGNCALLGWGIWLMVYGIMI